MGLQIAPIMRAISKLRVAGLTMRMAVPQALDPTDAPSMWPRPDGFVSDFEVQVDSFGSASAKKTVTYTLTYIFARSAVGAGEGFEYYQSMTDMAFKIMDAFVAHDALQGEAIDVTPSFGEFGLILDASDKPFFGAELRIAVTEFVN